MKKQRSPGPAAYNIKSTVCQDAPAYSFGTMKRPAPNFKGISPGPVYQLKASLGKNKDETFKAMPAFKFGTSERPDPAGNSRMRESHFFLRVFARACCFVCFGCHACVRKRALLRNKMQQKALVEKCASMYCIYTLLQRLTLDVINPFPFLPLADRAPGPGEYALGSAVGPVKPPIFKSASSFGFGTASRLPGDPPVPKRLARDIVEKLNSTPGNALSTDLFDQPLTLVKDVELTATPGPGHYDGQSWKKKRQPEFSFGTSAQRPAASTRATRVPGPGQYKPAGTTGKQTAPTMRKGPVYGFGTAKLGGSLSVSDVPGPGSYLIPSAFGTQPHSDHRSIPQFSFGCTPRDAGME